MKTSKEALEYIESHSKWKDQLNLLRDLLNSFPFVETIKWGIPVYTMDNKNMVGLAAFKNHLALWFYQGALLQENTQLLYNAQEEKTKGLRQIRFDENSPIEPEILKPYVEEAILLHKQGKEIQPEKKQAPEIPPLMEKEFSNKPPFRKKFYELTPGRQREYCGYIKDAKREDTKLKRLEKIIPMINKGIGLNDKYR